MNLLTLVLLGTLVVLTNGTLVGIADLVFNKYTTQTCPGFTVAFNTELFSIQNQNGTFKMDVEEKDLFGMSTTTHPCRMNGVNQGVCFYKDSLIKKKIPAIKIYFDTGVKHKVGRIDNIVISSLAQVFGPMELHSKHVGDNEFQLAWYLPYLRTCTHHKIMQGFHFKCSSSLGGCGNYTSMSFQCDRDTGSTFECTTLKKDMTITCKNYNYYVPLDGREPNTSATVEHPYKLCEMKLSNLKNGDVYRFKGRYTFNDDFSNDELPEVYDEWSTWSNTAVIETIIASPTISAPVKGENQDDETKKPQYWLSIVFGGVLAVLLVIGVSCWIRQRIAVRSSPSANDFRMITPRTSNSSIA